MTVSQFKINQIGNSHIKRPCLLFVENFKVFPGQEKLSERNIVPCGVLVCSALVCNIMRLNLDHYEWMCIHTRLNLRSRFGSVLLSI